MTISVDNKDIEYMVSIIEKICTEVGPGVPGSSKERARAEILKEELAPVVDEIEEEPFTLSPGAFLGWLRLGCLLEVLAALFFFLRGESPLLFSILAFACMLLLVIIALAEFVFYREMLDPLFAKAGSSNIVGRVLPRRGEQVKRILILAGHHDSAVAFNWLTYARHGYYLALFFIFSSMLALTVGTGVEAAIHLIGAGTAFPEVLMTTASLCLVPPALVSAFFFLGPVKDGGTVPGAADNLSACAVTAAAARYLRRHPHLVPPETELRFISFGAEEAGCRGARRYVRRHLDELRSKDAALCNMDTLFDPRIWIFTSDRNGTVANSPELVAELKGAAEAAGVPHKTSPFPFGGGGTDTMRFSERGIKAATLYSMKVPGQMVRFYHTPRDDHSLYENPAQQKALGNALAICLAWIESYRSRKSRAE